jgi:Tfp pilus assembly protein PilF
MNDVKAAADDFNLAISIAPKNVDAWIGRAQAFEASNDMNRARAAYARALEIEPANARAKQLFARAGGKYGETYSLNQTGG